MKYKQIGKSGLITSEITLGTMLFGEQSNRSTPEKEAKKMIDYYIGHGGNHIDTADIYADGKSEEIIGRALGTKRKEIILSTKIRHRTGQNVNAEGLSRHHILNGIDNSLRRLKTDYVDILYIHCFDPITPISETVSALEDIVKKGKVRYIGISNFKAWQLMKAVQTTQSLKTSPFICAQYQYSLIQRDISYEFTDIFENEGIGLLPWSPLGGGFLTGKYSRSKPSIGRISKAEATSEEAWERRNQEKNWIIVDELKRLSNLYQVTPSQISIAWLLAQKTVSSVVIGPRTMEQLEDNLKATHCKLNENEIINLNNLSAPRELYPYRFIEQYGQRAL